MIGDFGGLATKMPLFSGLFLVFALSSLGLPGLNNFVGEFLILVGTFASAYRWWVILATFGTVLAAIYLLWAYQRAFHGPVSGVAQRPVADLRPREIAMFVPALIAMVFIGIYPGVFLDRIRPSTTKVVHQMHISVIPSAGGQASGEGN
jgi:NADH-quinone oxidoreductase subunit M